MQRQSKQTQSRTHARAHARTRLATQTTTNRRRRRPRARAPLRDALVVASGDARSLSAAARTSVFGDEQRAPRDAVGGVGARHSRKVCRQQRQRHALQQLDAKSVSLGSLGWWRRVRRHNTRGSLAVFAANRCAANKRGAVHQQQQRRRRRRGCESLPNLISAPL